MRSSLADFCFCFGTPARLASPIAQKQPCALVGADDRVRRIACAAAGGDGRPPPPESARAGRRRVGLSCGRARTAQPFLAEPSMAACLCFRVRGSVRRALVLARSCRLVSARPVRW
jgi:hypothetical protein